MRRKVSVSVRMSGGDQRPQALALGRPHLRLEFLTLEVGRVERRTVAHDHVSTRYGISAFQTGSPDNKIEAKGIQVWPDNEVDGSFCIVRMTRMRGG